MCSHSKYLSIKNQILNEKKFKTPVGKNNIMPSITLLNHIKLFAV